MFQNDEALEILFDLGLTSLQAKVYLALTAVEKAGAKEISEISDVARQDIYRIILTLENLGLVEELIGKPILYKAIPLKAGSFMLLQERKKEQLELEEKIDLFLKRSKERKSNEMVQGDNLQIGLSSERKILVKRLEKALSEAEACDMIFPAENLGFVISVFFESIETALEKGKKIRIITEKTEGAPRPRELEILRKNPLFEIKFVPLLIDLRVVINRHKEVNIRVSSSSPKGKSGVLYSNCAEMIEMAEIMFEALWRSAQKKEVWFDTLAQ
jgi:sugar-specific transcriptional regulator TrmB